MTLKQSERAFNTDLIFFSPFPFANCSDEREIVYTLVLVSLTPSDVF